VDLWALALGEDGSIHSVGVDGRPADEQGVRRQEEGSNLGSGPHVDKLTAVWERFVRGSGCGWGESGVENRSVDGVFIPLIKDESFDFTTTYC
jgi:hypothetical protein